MTTGPFSELRSVSCRPPPCVSAAAFGVGLYLTGVFLFALNDALGKWLVKDYGVGQLMLLRSIGAAVVLAPMVDAARLGDFRFPAGRR